MINQEMILDHSHCILHQIFVFSVAVQKYYLKIANCSMSHKSVAMTGWFCKKWLRYSSDGVVFETFFETVDVSWYCC